MCNLNICIGKMKIHDKVSSFEKKNRKKEKSEINMINDIYIYKDIHKFA